MEKRKILSKLNIDIKDYNNELEKILENKLFSYDVKNLLLSMLYKIENAYKDYETVKVEVPSKREYIENILTIIKEKCLKIYLVKSGTPEAEDLERNNITFKVDRNNGEIVCIQNELVILTAILKLDITKSLIEMPYEYMETPIFKLLEYGKIDSEVEVIRDFNGWSWDIDKNNINDIEYNYIYKTMILLNSKKSINDKNLKKILNIISKISIKKYLDEANDIEYNEKFEKLKNKKQKRLELFNKFSELFLDSKDDMYLSTTYRYGQELADITSKFVLKNNEQTTKHIKSIKHLEHPIELCEYRGYEEYEEINKIVHKIYSENPNSQILILARTNDCLNKLAKSDFSNGVNDALICKDLPDAKIEALTMHRSKGLTSDQVIVFGLREKVFPSKNKASHWIFEYFKLDSIAEKIPYAEERRLFYVALTRTRNKVYLVVPSSRGSKSVFVNEIEDMIK